MVLPREINQHHAAYVYGFNAHGTGPELSFALFLFNIICDVFVKFLELFPVCGS